MGQFLTGTRVGQFVLVSGWLFVLAAVGYELWAGHISIMGITAVVSAILAGGGVHLVYNHANAIRDQNPGGPTK